MTSLAYRIRLLHRQPRTVQGLFVVTGNIIVSLVSAILLIVVSRTLGPTEFGVFSANFALIILVLKGIDFGVNLSTQRLVAKDPSRAIAIGEAVLKTKLLIALCMIIIGALFSPQIAGQILLMKRIYLVRIGLILSGFYFLFDFVSQYLDGIKHFQHSLIANLIRVVATLAAVLLMSLHTPPDIIAITVIYSLAPLGALLYAFKYTGFSPILKLSFSPAALRQVYSGAKHIGIAVLATAAAEHLDIVMVKYFTTSIDTGLYAVADKIGTFINFLAASVLVVLSVQAAGYVHRSDIGRFLKQARLFGAICIAFLLLVLPFAKWGLLFIVGPAYAGSVLPLRLIIIASALHLAAVPYYALFYSYNKPRFYSFYGILLILVLLTSNLFLIPLLGIIGAGLAQIITRLVLLFFVIGYCHFEYHRLPPDPTATSASAH